MELKEWIKKQSPEKQEQFFMKAARFFSSRELTDIIKLVNSGYSLYSAHLKSGVLDRYTVDLNNLRRSI